jgi:glutathione S-transferase
MTTYKLHCFKESGNSYKVALTLSIAGLPWEKVVVDYFGGETRRPAWRAEVNELGEVPVLEVDGRKLSQSGVILLHLVEHVSGLWLSEQERPEVLRWLLFDNHKFTANLATYRWLRTFAAPAPHEAVLAFMHQRIAGAFDIVEKHLGQQRFIIGDRLTIADLSLAGYVFYPKEELGFDISTEYPNMSAWMERIAQMPGWLAPYELLG